MAIRRRSLGLASLGTLAASGLGCRFDAAPPVGPPVTPAVPPELGDGLEVAPASSVGLDPAALDRSQRQLHLDVGGHPHSTLLLVGGRLVHERYFEGYDAAVPHDLRSATKSLTALVTMMAVDQGHLRLDTPVSALFPDAPPHWDAIVLEHLLSMSSGIDCNDLDPRHHRHEDAMYRRRDWLRYVLRSRGEIEPGSEWRYCTGGYVLAGEMVARAAGQPFDALAEKLLFAPLGITNARWARTPRGVIDSGGHLRLTPRQLARIGLLLRGRGSWEGRVLLSSDGLASLLRPRQMLAPNYGYGLGWHLVPIEDGRVRSYHANGNGGQILALFPELDLVAVFTGGDFNDPGARAPFEWLRAAVIPALQADREER